MKLLPTSEWNEEKNIKPEPRRFWVVVNRHDPYWVAQAYIREEDAVGAARPDQIVVCVQELTTNIVP